MAGPLFFDRVRESSTTTGTSDFTLDGAATGGFQSFSAVLAINDTTYYAIQNPSMNEWEVGLGTLTASTTLQRTTILASSNSGSIVNFSAGTKSVFITIPAAFLTGGSSSSLPVVDTTSIVKGSVDATKLMRFEIDGFTTGATRVLTPPDADITIAGLEISQTFLARQNVTQTVTTTGVDNYGVFITHIWNPSGASGQVSHGLKITLDTPAANANNIGALKGFLSTVTHAGTGTVSEVYAYEGTAQATGATTITEMGGGKVTGQGLGTTITSLYGLYADAISLGSTVTSMYGVKARSFDFIGTSTTGYAVHARATGSSVCFAFYAEAGINRFNALASTDPILQLRGIASQTGILFQLQGESSTTAGRQQVDIDSAWDDATDATRKAACIVRVWDTAARTLFYGQTDGSGANFSFFTTGSYGSGRNVVFIPNAAVDPSADPTGGGILYVSSGALLYRGSSGTITTLAAAEPHCPVCGADFIKEFENKRYGYLFICLQCLAEEIGERPWILRRKRCVS